MHYILLFLIFFVNSRPISGEYSLPVNLLPVFLINEEQGLLYVCTDSMPTLDSSSCRYGISVLDNKNNNFMPGLSERAIVDGRSVENPLWGVGFSYAAVIKTINPVKSYSFPVFVPINETVIYVLLKSFSYAVREVILLSQSITLPNGEIPLRVRGIGSILNGVSLIVESVSGKFFVVGMIMNEYMMGGKSLFQIEQAYVSFCDSDNESLFIGSSDVITLDSNFPVSADTPSFHPLLFYSGYGSSGIRAMTILGYPAIFEGACDEESIIATTVPNRPVFIHQAGTMNFSTGLSYGIVLGGAYDDKTKSFESIFSFPLINDSDSPYFLWLANVNKNPFFVFSEFPPYQYKKTVFSDPAEAVGDLYAQDSLQAMVGGGNFFSQGKIIKFVTSNDAVYVIADSIDSSKNGGVFFSQAIFDKWGKVSSWTPWQRGSLVENATTIANFLGTRCFMEKDLQKKVFRLSFEINGPFKEFFFNLLQFPFMTGGIQGITDIPTHHPGVKNDVAANIYPSFVIFIGNNGVIVAQSAKNYFEPIMPDSIWKSVDGSTASFDFSKKYNALVMSGGALDTAGALVSADLLFDGSDSWFVLGGIGGVFILSDELGGGIKGQLTSEFSTLPTTLSWHRLGNFVNVKKVIGYNNVLYVLTNDALWRIPISSMNIARKTGAQSYEIANANSCMSKISSEKMQGYFNDFIASNNAVIIASNSGLWVNGNGTSPLSACNNFDCAWKKIFLSENFIGEPISFWTVSRSGYVSGWGNDSVAASASVASANVYLLCNSLLLHGGSIYRLALYDNSGGINDESLVLINNYFVKDIVAPYYTVTADCFSCGGDGGIWFLNSFAPLGVLWKGMVRMLPFNLTTGMFQKNDLSLLFSAPEYNMPIGRVSYLSGWGSWVMSTKIGICILS